MKHFYLREEFEFNAKKKINILLRNVRILYCYLLSYTGKFEMITLFH